MSSKTKQYDIESKAYTTTGTLISDSLSYLGNTISVGISEVIDTNIIPNTYGVTGYYTLS